MSLAAGQPYGLMRWASTSELFGMQTQAGSCAERKWRLWSWVCGKEGVLCSRQFPSHAPHDEQWSENVCHISDWPELRQCMKLVSFCWKCIWWCGNALPGCLGRDSVTHMWWRPRLYETSAQGKQMWHSISRKTNDLLKWWLEDVCYRWIPIGPKMTVVIPVWLKYDRSFRKAALKPKKQKTKNPRGLEFKKVGNFLHGLFLIDTF